MSPKTIYDVTINIDESIHAEWKFWVKKHILQVLATGKFLSAKLTRVLVEEAQGDVTYSIQYTAISRQALDLYYQEDAERLRREAALKFADKMLAFRTELEVIDEYLYT